MLLEFIKKAASVINGSPDVDVNATNELGNTLLIDAASMNNTVIVDALLKRGADPDIIGFCGSTALTYAVKENNPSMMLLLISHGANVNGVGDKLIFMRPLCQAALANAGEAARVLIDHGADLDCLDSQVKTPLMTAAENNALEVAGLLIQAGAKLEAKGGAFNYTRTALCYAVMAAHEEMTELLIKNNAKIKAINQVKKEIPPKMKRWLKTKGILK